MIKNYIENILKIIKFIGEIFPIIIIPVMVFGWLDLSGFLSKIGWNLNIEFWGSMLGTYTTILSVYWTIRSEGEKTREDRRLAIKPFFKYEFNIGLYPFREIQAKRRNILDYEVNMQGEGDVLNLIVPIKITNIGFGHGIIVDSSPILVNNQPVTAARQSEGANTKTIRTKLLTLNSEEVFLIKINSVPKDEIDKLRITIYYTDLNGGTKYFDTLSVNDVNNIKNKVDDVFISKSLEKYFKKSKDKGYLNDSDKSQYEKIVDDFLNKDGGFIVDLDKITIGKKK